MEKNTNITHSEPTDIKYPDFNSLAPYEEDLNLLRLSRQLSDNIIAHIEDINTYWRHLFMAINELRRLRKYYPECFCYIFDNLIDKISALVTSPKTCISKITLILISEIFSNYTFDDLISEWMAKLIPKVMNKTISEINVIKEVAMLALYNLSVNMLYPETVETLLSLIRNKNVNISNISFDCLMGLLSNYAHYDKSGLENNINWGNYIHETLEIFSIKLSSYTKKSVKMIEFLEVNLGEKFLENYMVVNYSDDQEYTEKIIEMFKEIRIMINSHAKMINSIKENRKSIKGDKRKFYNSNVKNKENKENHLRSTTDE